MKPTTELASKRVLTLAGAEHIAKAARAEAANNGWKMVICVVDDGGHLIYLERMDGAQLGSVQIAQDKARTAVLFKRPSKALEEAVAGGRTVLLKLTGAVPVEGGIPVFAGSEGELVGAIGVSGASSTQDGQVAAAGARALEAALTV
jgi:glc operon protein GlcG